MELYPKNRVPFNDVKKFIVIFYIVGLLGFIIPFTKPLFITITPFALLLNIYLLAVYHKYFSIKYVSVFLFIYISGYFIEVIGVNTGLIFGNYSYGKALGIKLFGTPLLIGVNWLFLTYTSTTILGYFKVKKWYSVLISPILMVVYDMVLEQVAPKMNMWSWVNSEVPFKNYFAWYIISFVFVLLLKVFKTETKNPLGAILFICQFVFLLLLSVLL